MTERSSTAPKPGFNFEVETIFNAISLIESGSLRDDFLRDCRAAGLRMHVAEELVGLAKAYLAKLPQSKVAGPDCPACPPAQDP